MENDQINPNQGNQQEPRGEAENQELHYQPKEDKDQNLDDNRKSDLQDTDSPEEIDDLSGDLSGNASGNTDAQDQ